MSSLTLPPMRLRLYGILVLYFACLPGLLSSNSASATETSNELPSIDKGARRPVLPVSLGETKQTSATLPAFRHELWGNTHFGEGYVYGPTNRESGMTVVDIDLDGDHDFVFPDNLTGPQLVRNLGNSNAFVPGGVRILDIEALPGGMIIDLGMDFGDLTGNGRPDMVAVTYEFNPFRKRIIWLRNEGPLENPHYSYQGILYNSPESVNMWPALVDLNDNGLLDLVIVDAFLEEPVRQHRVFLLSNIGTAIQPEFATPVEMVELSVLLPMGMPYKDVKAVEASTQAGTPPKPAQNPERKQAQRLTYNLGDIDFVDWNINGVLDFMFYTRDEGLFWVRNLGTRSNPVWDTQRGPNLAGVPNSPLYAHLEEDGKIFAEGTFRIRPNPEGVKPGIEWLDEMFLSVDGRLKHYRFYTEHTEYRLIQQNAVAYPAGQGSIAFWDYDDDGDLDMFRTGISDGPETNLLLFPNVGAPYAPVWGEYVSLTEVPLNSGDAFNNYRDEPFAIADHDNILGPDLFVQKQDGRVWMYFAYPAYVPGELPEFDLAETNFGDMVLPGHTVLEARGIVIADFDSFEDEWMEVITAYRHTTGGAIVMYDTLYDILHDMSDQIPAPTGGILNPIYIEGLATADLIGNGIPDLIITLSDYDDFSVCNHHYYQTILTDESPWVRFEYVGKLNVPDETDNQYANRITFSDINGNGNEDLFIGHRHPPDSFLRQYLRFYRNNDRPTLDFWRTRVVSGQNWNLFWNGELPDYNIIQNPSGGFVINPGNYTAGNFSPAVDVLQSIDQNPNVRIFLDVLPPVQQNESKAVIVVGDVAGSSLYPAFSSLASIAYFVLRTEGLPKESIRLFADTNFDADGDGINDVYAKPTVSALQQTITQWGRNADRLLIYLVDHGRREQFRLNASEYLDANVLAAWLDQIQAGGSGPQITTVIDTCESGSFIRPLRGNRRINISSAGVGPIEGVALFDSIQNISFSLNFWGGIYNGYTYGQAFRQAKIAIEAINPLQIPQLDDDGSGVGNQPGDGVLADQSRPGANFAYQAPGVHIGEVAPSRAINQNSALLWLGDVVSSFPVEESGALIVPPNFQRPSLTEDEDPITGLEWVSFTENEALGRWEGSFNGFNQGGVFQIQYFVKAGGQVYASPRIGFIDRIGIPDAWEPNDTFSTARWIPVNSVQGHNFHRTGDVDWLKFTSPFNETATISIIAPRPNCQAEVALFRLADLEQNANAAPIRLQAAQRPGQEVVFEHHFSTIDQYVLRIRQVNPNISGEGTSYMVIVAVGTGGGELIPTNLFVTVVENNTTQPIAGAQVSFDGRNVGATTSEGIVQMVVPSYGNYTVTAQKTGYQTVSNVVQVNSILANTVLTLNEEGGEEPPPACGCNPSQGNTTNHFGNVLIMLSLCAILTWYTKRHYKEYS